MQTKVTYQGRSIEITDLENLALTALTIDGAPLYEWITCPHDGALVTAKSIIDSNDPRLPELGAGRRRVSLDYQGRRITAIRRKVDGFDGVEILVNREHYWTYGPMSSKSLCTIAGAVAQTRRDLDAVDERPEAAYEAYMYREDDPRRAEVLARLNQEA